MPNGEEAEILRRLFNFSNELRLHEICNSV